MDFNYMSDKQIIDHIATYLDTLRLSKQLSSEEMAQKGGHNAQSFSNFVNKHTNIKLETLIQMLRGLGELNHFQTLFEKEASYSPLSQPLPLPKRIRKKKSSNTPNTIVWKDSE